MNIAPRSKADWVRAYFITLEALALSLALAINNRGGIHFIDSYRPWPSYLALASTGLLLVSSSVYSFIRPRLAVPGFLVVALVLLISYFLPPFRS